MIHLRQLATVLGLVWLSACAAPGYHFNAGEFHQTPNDPCQRQEVRSAGAVNWLNMKVGASDGPAKRVVSIQSPSGSGYGGALSCRAFLVFEDGTTQVGQLTVIDPGGAAPLSVTWRTGYAGRRAATGRTTTACGDRGIRQSVEKRLR